MRLLLTVTRLPLVLAACELLNVTLPVPRALLLLMFSLFTPLFCKVIPPEKLLLPESVTFDEPSKVIYPAPLMLPESVTFDVPLISIYPALLIELDKFAEEAENPKTAPLLMLILLLAETEPLFARYKTPALIVVLPV